jgi:hypothetical protein
VQEFIVLLRQIAESQQRMKVDMREILEEFRKRPTVDFDFAYKRVKEIIPAHPLEQHGISMDVFDRLLDKFESNPNVREWMAKLMDSPKLHTSEAANKIEVKELVAVHQLMLAELEALVSEIQKKSDLNEYDNKAITIAAQALVGCKVEKEFSFTSEDIESAVLLQHCALALDQEFADVNEKIQETMSQLMRAVVR